MRRISAILTALVTIVALAVVVQWAGTGRAEAALSNFGMLPAVFRGYSLGLPPPTWGNASLTGTTNPAVNWAGTGVPGATVVFYLGPDCTGSFVANGLVQPSGTWIVTTTMPNPQTTTGWSIRQFINEPPGTTGANASYTRWSNCNPEYHGVYGTPQIQNTTPPSPGNTTTPTINGAAQANQTIRVFTNNTCSGAPVATATIGANGQWSVPVTVPLGTTLTFWVNVLDFRGDNTPCSSALNSLNPGNPPAQISYFAQSNAQARATITGTNPGSPSNNNAPQVFGTADAGNVGRTVNLFTSASCAPTVLATGIIDSNNFWTIQSPTITTSTTYFVSIAGTSVCSNGWFYNFTGGSGGGQPTLNTSPNGRGQFPTFSGTNAPAGSTVYLYRNACVASAVDGISFADSTGFFTIIPSNPVPSPSTFFVNANINGNFTPCSIGSFYSP